MPTWKNNKFIKHVPKQINKRRQHMHTCKHQNIHNIGTWVRWPKPISPFLHMSHEKCFGRKNNDNPLANDFCDVWCHNGSYCELLFCRCACALVVFYISIVFDNDGQLRMMNKWMMVENEFERLDDTTSSFSIINWESIRISHNIISIPFLWCNSEGVNTIRKNILGWSIPTSSHCYS